MRSKLVLVVLALLIVVIILSTILCVSRLPAEKTESVDSGDAPEPPVPLSAAIPEGFDTAQWEPQFSFIPDEEVPLPTLETAHPLGASARLRGTVHSDVPLAAVRVSINCKHNDDPFYPYILIVNFPDDADVFDYPLDGADTVEESSVDAMTRFADLKVGTHTLRIFAKPRGVDRFYEVTKTQFNVLSDHWERFTIEDFKGSYESAFAFFQDDDRFIYRYQWVYGRYIIADPAWEAKYIITIPAYPEGMDWLIHIDGLPYYERAFAYLRSARVRVHGTNGDSGIRQLSELILSYAGSYVSRFTSSRATISHHTFGTATDVNAQLAPNLNAPENRGLVDTEVRDFLSYNDIRTLDGEPYYDFVYSGSYANTAIDIPESVINYLLYELAFFRAGFQWGHYYISTSDAMHFTLTDAIGRDHSGADGLRKVYDYYD